MTGHEPEAFFPSIQQPFVTVIDRVQLVLDCSCYHQSCIELKNWKWAHSTPSLAWTTWVETISNFQYSSLVCILFNDMLRRGLFLWILCFSKIGLNHSRCNLWQNGWLDISSSINERVKKLNSLTCHKKLILVPFSIIDLPIPNLGDSRLILFEL